jgi:hypothetical protein
MSAPTNETAEKVRPTDGAATGEAPPPSTTDGEDEPDTDLRAHLADVADGCGCAEVWEHLSDGREE